MAFDDTIREFKGKQTYNGTDIMVVFSVPGTQLSYIKKQTYKVSTELQTITMSSTTSVLPVRRCGEAKPAAFTKGARTFAGSMVLTLMDSDPFKDIFSIDALNSSMVNDQAWHIDQMPPFDILVLAQNETGGIGVQIISNARIVQWGSTLSVDDLYTEHTYTYVAEDISPFLSSVNLFNTDGLPKVDNLLPRTPDDLYRERQAESNIERNQLANLIKQFEPNTVLVYPKNTNIFSDPAIPNDLMQKIVTYGQDLSDLI